MPLRVAVDANVLIAGFGWPRWPYEVLRHAEQGDYRLVLSPVVIAEARRRIARHLPEQIDAFELFLLSVAYELAPLPTAAEVAANQKTSPLPSLFRQRRSISLSPPTGISPIRIRRPPGCVRRFRASCCRPCSCAK